MKAIQSVIYAITKVNIFANASASSYSSMADSASDTAKATKSLAGVHDEINNVSSSDSSSSGSGSSSPSFDLSTVDTELSGLSEKLYNFFKPLIDSWNTYGAELIEQLKITASQVAGMLSTVWSSFEKVITNGTVYTTLELILAIIGNIAEAFTIAWTNASIGDQIVQNLFDTFNLILSIINQIAQSTGFQNMLTSVLNVLNAIILTVKNIATAFGNAWSSGSGDVILTNIGNILEKIFDTIENITESTGFQAFLDGVLDTFEGLSTFVEPVVNDICDLVEPLAEIALSIAGTVLSTIGEALKTIGENEVAVTVLEALAIAIGVVTVATTLYKTIKSGETAILIANAAAWIAANAPILLITAALTAIIAVIILVVKHWDEIKETVSNVVEVIKEKVTEWVENIKTTITDFIEKIKTAWNNFWEGIKTVVTNIWNTITTTISNVINGIKTTITNVINAIKTVWDNIWNGIKTTVTNIFNSIKTTITNVINAIKTGISTALNNIKTAWSNAWNTVKTTVTNIFNGIWSAIKGVVNKILAGIETFVNGIINGVNKVLSAINAISSAVGGLVGISGTSFKISTISLPRLAKGNVAYEETLGIFGEYAGASSNPEITAPQSVLYDTMTKALQDSGNNDEKQINLELTVNVSNQKLGQILINDLRNITRRSGKGIEAIVG